MAVPGSLGRRAPEMNHAAIAPFPLIFTNAGCDSAIRH